MPVSKKAELMLYALAKFLEETNKRFRNSPLEISTSKIEFIRNIKKLKIFKIKERAIYKNLEELEKNKLILYSNRDLRLSRKGLNYYTKLRKNIEPLVKLTIEMEKTRLKVRTKLKL